MLHQLLRNAKGTGTKSLDQSMLCHKLSIAHQMAMMEPTKTTKIKACTNIVPRLAWYIYFYIKTQKNKDRITYVS